MEPAKHSCDALAKKDPPAQPGTPELKPEAAPDMEADTDATIAAFGGDPREAVKALLTDNAALQSELDFASLAMSYGFTRGWSARLREGSQGIRAAHSPELREKKTR
jgi:hypothetical protein